MTRLTAMRIQDDPDVFASSFGPVEGKYGLYVGTYEKTPSGSTRPRDLLTSEPVYDSAIEAKKAAEKVIRETRKAGKKILKMRGV